MLTSEQIVMRDLLDFKKKSYCTAEQKGYYKNLRWTDKNGNTTLHKKSESEAVVNRFLTSHVRPEVR